MNTGRFLFALAWKGVLAALCTGHGPSLDGKVNALPIALAQNDAPGLGPCGTVDVLPSTHASLTRSRGDSSEPGLGLARSLARRLNFSCMPGPGLDGKVNALPSRF